MIQANLSKFIAQCLEKELKIKLEKEFLMHGMEKIDYFYESKKLRILMEVELRRQDPVNNVVKAWKILEGVKDEKQSFLLHFFSGKYSRKEGIGRNQDLQEAQVVRNKTNTVGGSVAPGVGFEPTRPRKVTGFPRAFMRGLQA